MNDFLTLLHRDRLTLIMSLPVNDPALCAAAFDAGADVVKVHINVQHRASGTHFGRLSEERGALETMLAHKAGPMGLVTGGTLEAAGLDLDGAAAMPFSFFSLYAHCAPTAALRCSVPLMLACDSTYSLDEVEYMADAGASVLEASVIPGAEYGTALSARDLMRYRAIARRTTLPVVVPTQRRIEPDDAALLRAAGVKGLMIGAVVTGRDASSVARAVTAFRRAIEAGV